MMIKKTGKEIKDQINNIIFLSLLNQERCKVYLNFSANA